MGWCKGGRKRGRRDKERERGRRFFYARKSGGYLVSNRSAEIRIKIEGNWVIGVIRIIRVDRIA